LKFPRAAWLDIQGFDLKARKSELKCESTARVLADGLCRTLFNHGAQRFHAGRAD
jgi:hypothetical protein